MNNTSTRLSDNRSAREKIEDRVNPANAAAITVGAGGAMNLSNMTDIMEFAKLMSISQVAVPKHLRDNPGACLAIVMQASEWQMSPFAVANKSYSVNDRMAYEAQLVSAVILRRAPIKGRIKYAYEGEAEKRVCIVTVTCTDGEVIEHRSPMIGNITVKNSPLWKSDSDQQLGYYAVRAMCRRHFPDVLLGVYTMDEMQDSPSMEPRTATGRVVNENPMTRNIAPTTFDDLPQTPAADPQPETFEESEAAQGVTSMPPRDEPEPEPEPESTPEPEPAPAAAEKPAASVEEKAERKTLIDEIKATLTEEGTTLNKFGDACRACEVLTGMVTLRDVEIETLRTIHENRLDILKGEYVPY